MGGWKPVADRYQPRHDSHDPSGIGFARRLPPRLIPDRYLAMTEASMPPASARDLGDRFQQEHGDQPVRALLVVGVGRVDLHRPVPPLGAFLSGELPRDHVPFAGTVLQLDLGIREQIGVPGRVLRGAADRRHRGIAALVLDPHHRVLPELAALRTPTRHDDDRQPRVPQGERTCAPRALIQLDLVAHPLLTAGLVFTVERHGSIQPQMRVALAPCTTTRRPGRVSSDAPRPLVWTELSAQSVAVSMTNR